MNAIYSSQLALSISIVSLMILSKTTKEDYVKFIGANYLLELVVILIELYGVYKISMSNPHIRLCYYLISLCILFLIYHCASGKHYAIFFIAGYIMFAGIVLLGWLRLTTCLLLNNFVRSLYSFLAFFLSIVHFYTLIVKSKIKQIHLNPFFWFNASVFFYHGEILWLLAAIQSVDFSPNRFTVYQLFEAFSKLVSQVTTLVSVGLYIKKNNRNSSIIWKKK